MIVTKDLRFSYTNLPFHFPDIQAGKRSTLLITGASGKGKTTFLHLLGGLLKPHAGMIIIQGVDITQLSNAELDRFRGQQIGIIFQQAHYIAAVNVLDNVLLAAVAGNKKIRRERAMQLLSQLGLADKTGKKPGTLSLGQQQRLSIARALVNQPALILADEPTSSLDDDNCIKVIDILREQAHQNSASLIVVSHDHRLHPFFDQKIEW